MSKELELVKEGYANGVAPGFPLTEDQKWEMVDRFLSIFVFPHSFILFESLPFYDNYTETK